MLCKYVNKYVNYFSFDRLIILIYENIQIYKYFFIKNNLYKNKTFIYYFFTKFFNEFWLLCLSGMFMYCVLDRVLSFITKNTRSYRLYNFLILFLSIEIHKYLYHEDFVYYV